ncbi:MAG: hypothetical protein AB2763_03835, partial [Candidatus Thiodiazotropha endolucinida]
ILPFNAAYVIAQLRVLKIRSSLRIGTDQVVRCAMMILWFSQQLGWVSVIVTDAIYYAKERE